MVAVNLAVLARSGIALLLVTVLASSLVVVLFLWWFVATDRRRCEAIAPGEEFRGLGTVKADEFWTSSVVARQLAGAERTRLALNGGMLGGTLVLTGLGVRWEPGWHGKVLSYPAVTLPWIKTATVEAAKVSGLLDSAAVQLRLCDGSQIEIVTRGSKRLADAVARIHATGAI